MGNFGSDYKLLCDWMIVKTFNTDYILDDDDVE